MKDRLGAPMMMFVHARFDTFDDVRVLVVDCAPGKAPVFLKDGNAERFFVRSGVTTLELSGNDAQAFIRQRFAR